MKVTRTPQQKIEEDRIPPGVCVVFQGLFGNFHELPKELWYRLLAGFNWPNHLLKFRRFKGLYGGERGRRRDEEEEQLSEEKRKTRWIGYAGTASKSDIWDRAAGAIRRGQAGERPSIARSPITKCSWGSYPRLEVIGRRKKMCEKRDITTRGWRMGSVTRWQVGTTGWWKRCERAGMI